MRYRIEANILGVIAVDRYLETVHTDDRNTAEIVFKFFLDNGVRPVRLIDKEGEHSMMEAANGRRLGC